MFFKQTLLGLLSSSEHLQLYIIDLKGGLEAKEFDVFPNVKIAKTEGEAVEILASVKQEMQRRFLYLEQNGHTSVNHKRDRMDKIIVAVDEASVLYARPSRKSEKTELIEKARELTSSLAALSRAAGMSLIFATQKASKEVIETRIQENISARMVFRMNTLQGSLVVLGNKAASTIDATKKGRGIWSFGSKQLMVQAPYLSEAEITDECKSVAEDYISGKKKIFQELLIAPSLELKENQEKAHYELEDE